MEDFRIPNDGINTIIEEIEKCMHHTRIVAREKAFRNSESSSFLIYTHERIILVAPLSCIKEKNKYCKQHQGEGNPTKGKEKREDGLQHISCHHSLYNQLYQWCLKFQTNLSTSE